MSIQTSSRILIVEDDEHIAHLLRFMLQRHGFDVTSAPDGQAGMVAIDSMEAPPALVLLDVMLPFIDGFELVAAIRARAGWHEVPIVMLTAKAMEQDIVRALDAGANDYVVKPFQPNELMARVRRFLRSPA